MVRKITTRTKNLCMFLVTLLSILMFCNFTVFAAESVIPDATSQFYINDFANIISDDVEKEMQEKAVALAESSDGIQVVVTTVRTIGDADPIYYTVDMYNKYGIGKNNMGVLIMLSVETRDIQIRIGDNMTKYLSDRKCGEIRDDYGISYFKNDQFETGVYEMQKATIEHISINVQSAENEVAVIPTDIEDVDNNGFFGMILSFLGIIGGGILSFFGLDKYFKKRKEKKAAEEIARIESSELVQKKNQRIQSLEAQLSSLRWNSETTINEKNEEITSLTALLESTQKKLHNLEERNKRAIIAYPDLNKKVDSIFAKEKEDADKKKAFAVEEHLRKVLILECTRHNLYKFSDACNAFQNLSSEQRKYVPAELINKVKVLYNQSVNLQRKFEEEEKIRKNKAKAAEVQKLILGALTCSVTRHALSDLTSVCRAYDNLTNEQKQYVTADVESLYAMKRKAKRLQDEYEEERRRSEREEEERRRRRQREEEERRRRESYNRSSSNFSRGSHSGFGGHSSGHGAGGKF